ncbi:hypothetical protein AAVH_09926 [Aphelenchoides avenae]|nr:hypothetical protein AAVH_09926 [Aphelenchus avenae]
MVHSTPISERRTINPHNTFLCMCTRFRTKEHSQLIGIVSFSVFICLCVVSFVVFQAISIVYIIAGIVIYAFLMESLFRVPKKLAILAYLIFEALQVGFYIAMIVYTLIPLVFDMEPEVCNNPTKGEPKPTCSTPKDWRATLAECLVFLLLLAFAKTYFVKVFTKYYKYLMWQEQHANELRAQYVNGRGVHINVDDHNIFPPPPTWDEATRDPSYGYALNLGVNPTSLPTLPSYSEAMTTEKPPPSDATGSAEPQTCPQENHPGSPSETPTIVHSQPGNVVSK